MGLAGIINNMRRVCVFYPAWNYVSGSLYNSMDFICADIFYFTDTDFLNSDSVHR